jgi:hypothetical protein
MEKKVNLGRKPRMGQDHEIKHEAAWGARPGLKEQIADDRLGW